MQHPATAEYRIEHDTMGEVRVPSDALYGAQTQRAVENFPISGRGLEPGADRRARAHQEAPPRSSNDELGVLDPDVADAIVAAADEVIAGQHHDQFPIDVYQTGTGTSLEHEHQRGARDARLAAARPPGAPERPRQRLAVVQRRLPDLGARRRHRRADRRPDPGARPPRESRSRRRPSCGRPPSSPAAPTSWTPPRSPSARSSAATPAQIRLGIERVQSALPRVAEVPLGGTAVGTGINTPLGFSAARSSRSWPRRPSCPSPRRVDHFEAQGARDGLVEASGALRVIAVSLTKICNDLRWMGSGPNTGLGELHIPDLQPGLVDHARQGQPGHPRGRPHGRARGSSATTRPSPGPAPAASSS